MFFLFSVSPTVDEEEKAEPPIPKETVSPSVQPASPTASEPAPPSCSQSDATEVPSPSPPTSPTSDLVRPAFYVISSQQPQLMGHSKTLLDLIIVGNDINS